MRDNAKKVYIGMSNGNISTLDLESKNIDIVGKSSGF
jgi:hypothetical protein